MYQHQKVAFRLVHPRMLFFCASLVLFGLLCFAPKTFAAIAYDNVSRPPGTYNSTSTSWTHVIGSGSNMVLVCGVSTNLPNISDLPGVTDNGVPMTQVAVWSPTQGPTAYYWLPNPPSGTNTVNVSGNFQYSYFKGACASYSGVSQIQPNNFLSGNSPTSTKTLALTLPTAPNAWLSEIANNRTGDPLTPGASTTVRGTNDAGVQMLDSGGALSAGSNSLIFTGDTNGLQSGILVELDPVSASDTAPIITSVLSASGEAGTALSYQITASNNPTSYNATNLPAGLSVNTATGLISGTPTSGGTSNVTISASNTAGTGTATLVITVVNSGTTGTPVISNIQIATTSPTSLLFTWTTDTLSDSFVGWGYNYESQDNGAIDTVGGTTSHSVTITGLRPGNKVDWVIRSRGFTNGVPDTSKATFASFDSTPPNAITMPAPPTAGTFDYWLVALGTHNITQGYDGYILTNAGFLSGTSNFKYGSYKVIVKNLPPYTAIHWPDQEYNGLAQGFLGTTIVPNDTLTQYSPNSTQFQLVTNVGGTTPTGQYTIDVTAATTLADGVTAGPTKDIPWTVNVIAPQSITVNGGGTITPPAIPDLSTWQSQMVQYGQKWCGTASSWDQSVSFYDGERTYQQVKAYDTANNLTGNPSQWDSCISQAWQVYVTRVLTSGVQAIWVFPQGLYNDYLNTNNASSSLAVHDLVHSWSIWAGIGQNEDPDNIREASYNFEARRLDNDLGVSQTVQVGQMASTLLGDIDEIVNNTESPTWSWWNEPFMDGLLSESLIEYYYDGHQNDTRVPVALKSLADYMWNNEWVAAPFGPGTGQFVYNSYENSIGIPLNIDGDDLRALNLLIAPLYGWLYMETGNPQYQIEGDTIWTSGVTDNPGAGIGWSGKNYSQQYRWSGDYVAWRSALQGGSTTGGGNGGNPPAISSFAASPSTITAGQSALLSWSVTNASSVTLDNGIGNVTNQASHSVAPGATTNYNLTATNPNGTVTRGITVVVNPVPNSGGGGNPSGGGGSSGGGGGGGGGGSSYTPPVAATTSSSVGSGTIPSSVSTSILAVINELRSLTIQLFMASNNGRSLTIGSQGTDVWALQVFLMIDGSGAASTRLASIGPTGIFGSITQAAVAEYQKSVGITPTSGYFGPTTRGEFIGGMTVNP